MVAEPRESLPRGGLRAIEFAEMFGMSVHAVRAGMKAGRIPSVQLGPKSWRIPARWVEDLREGKIAL